MREVILWLTVRESRGMGSIRGRQHAFPLNRNFDGLSNANGLGWHVAITSNVFRASGLQNQDRDS